MRKPSGEDKHAYEAVSHRPVHGIQVAVVREPDSSVVESRSRGLDGRRLVLLDGRAGRASRFRFYAPRGGIDDRRCVRRHQPPGPAVWLQCTASRRNIAVTAAGTRHPAHGLLATTSTTFTPPYLVTRLMATVEHVTHGRSGWNLVTSSQNRSFTPTSATTCSSSNPCRAAQSREA